MENQIILTTRLGKEFGYFSIWRFGKRVPGNYSPFVALRRGLEDEPYRNEELGNLDAPIALQCLIRWDEE